MGHPEAEAAIHSPSPCSGRKVLECIFSPEVCMFNHKGKEMAQSSSWAGAEFIS